MKFVEESYARELHRNLTNAFTATVQVTIEGAGVHWKCTVEHGECSCGVHCFDVKGPEYLASFDRNKKTRAMGRTSSMTDLVAAAKSWLLGQDVSQLHTQFEFVDQQKRALERIAAEVHAVCPELLGVGYELRGLMCDLYELWFRAGVRSCRLHFYGKNPHPETIFHWDDCQLFAFQVDSLSTLAGILKRWLFDHVAPSQLQIEFPWIDMSKAAAYYEQGRGIEGEFIESWDKIEAFYKKMSFRPAPSVQAFLTEMRTEGYDRYIRAGQSMYTLILSRSRRHGLKEGQPCVAFQFREVGMDVRASICGETSISVPAIALTEQIRALLDKLAAAGID